MEYQQKKPLKYYALPVCHSVLDTESSPLVFCIPARALFLDSRFRGNDKGILFGLIDIPDNIINSNHFRFKKLPQ
jgi:hypothetical protein